MENKTQYAADKKKQDQNSGTQPDPETLHTTDPQENMKGPVSSLVNKTKETMDEKGNEYVDGEEELDNDELEEDDELEDDELDGEDFEDEDMEEDDDEEDDEKER